jgi:hypothetical protein
MGGPPLVSGFLDCTALLWFVLVRGYFPILCLQARAGRGPFISSAELTVPDLTYVTYERVCDGCARLLWPVRLRLPCRKVPSLFVFASCAGKMASLRFPMSNMSFVLPHGIGDSQWWHRLS